MIKIFYCTACKPPPQGRYQQYQKVGKNHGELFTQLYNSYECDQQCSENMKIQQEDYTYWDKYMYCP